MMLRCFLVLIVLSMCVVRGVAQDVHHTQFYHTSTYLNPAMVGTTPQYRFTALYRNQWSGVPAYQQGFAAFDYNIDEYASGIGIMAQFDQNNATGFRNINVSGQYAFYFKVSKTWNMRLGGQLTYLSRSIDFSKLTFQDQLTTGGQTAEKLASTTINAADISIGGVLHHERFWAGLAIHHLNRPAINFSGNVDKLPMKISAHFGGKIILDGQQEEVYLLPSLQYYWQPPFNQFVVGTNLVVQPLVVGVWYRGTPWNTSSSGTTLQDALAGYVGIKFDNFMLGYSYDLTISPLRGGGGSHEISITYAPKFDKRYKRHTNYISCPMSY